MVINVDLLTTNILEYLCPIVSYKCMLGKWRAFLIRAIDLGILNKLKN